MHTKLIFGFYRAILLAAFPFLLLYAFWRVVQNRQYLRGIGERFGGLPAHFQRTARDSVWLHAVSVGEVLSAENLVRQLKTELPTAPIFVSCTTLAGREAAARKLDAIVDGIFYAPVDYVFAIRRVLRRIRPAVVVILETEIWPNWFREVRVAGCALVLVNARISDRAVPKYRRFAWCFSRVLAFPSAILVQSEGQRRRYLSAGAPGEIVSVNGNLKYDFQPKSDEITAPLHDWIVSSESPIWIAASTVGPEYNGDVDEDDAVLAALSTLNNVRLLLAPRKPDRFDVVAAKLTRAGLAFARRSELPLNCNAPVLLLDSIGELSPLFTHASVVFMGGTLADRGGHNILEPAAFARPIITGPHLENFAEIQALFRSGNGFVEITCPGELAGAVALLLNEPARAKALGDRAKALAESQRGATRKTVRTIVEARWSAVPHKVSYGPIRPLLSLLAKSWIAGGALKRITTSTGRLPEPAISVGGLAMGGSGKTPVVRLLARALKEEGWHPAVLTRGYARQQADAVTVLRAGACAPVNVTGDEAALILRDGFAHVGIGADRFAAGLAVLKELEPDIFILDDGFQHARLHRDLDIVVLDGLDPFAGGEVFPAATLREPLSALSRAHVIVISRCEGRRFSGVVKQIRTWNSYAPILLSETRPNAEDVLYLQGRDVFGFCAIGNPEAFRQTLLSIGCRLRGFVAFEDHHRYTQTDLAELARLANGTPLVATEKDCVKLPPGFPVRLLRVDVHATDIYL